MAIAKADPRVDPIYVREREERYQKDKERREEAAKSAVWPEADPRTGAPLKTGDPLTDDTPPYGIPKDPATGIAFDFPEGAEAIPPEDAVLAPEEPDTATLTAAEQNRWEVLTGERLQKDEETIEAESKRLEERAKERKAKAQARRAKPSLPARPDQGLPGGPGRAPRPDNSLPEQGKPAR